MFSFEKHVLWFNPHYDMAKNSHFISCERASRIIHQDPTLYGNSHYPILITSLREIYVVIPFSSQDLLLLTSAGIWARCFGFFYEKQLCVYEVNKRKLFLVDVEEERLKKKRKKLTAWLPDSWSPTEPTEPLSSIIASLLQDIPVTACSFHTAGAENFSIGITVHLRPTWSMPGAALRPFSH